MTTEEHEPAPLDIDQLDADPIAQWHRWFDDANAANLPDPTAFTLSTIGTDGDPDARMVLARRVDERGFGFYTHYESPKSQQLAHHPAAAGLFGWLALHRQVRVRGRVSRMTRAESDEYFAHRPRGHQLGAWASPQSSVLADRASLESLIAEAAARFVDEPVIPRPSHWGGWLLEPSVFEFWQGARDRLHDRFRYRLEHGAWIVERLAP